MIAEILLLAALAAGSVDYCNLDERGYCVDPVVRYDLRASEPNPRVRISCSLGNVLVVQLPEGESLKGDPAVGNAALFQFKLQKEPLMIMLWPKIPEGSDVTSADVLGETSNVQINLSSGMNILLELQISENSVQRVIFKSPDLEERISLKEKLRDEVRAEVEASFKAREENLEAEARKIALSVTAQGVMKRVHCTSLRERAMQDLLMVRAHRICHIGDHIYVEISVHNRARGFFVLDQAEILSVQGEEPQAMEAAFEWEGGKIPQLKFDRKARGVAVFPVTEETSSSEYGVRIVESAGNKRVVTLDGIEF